MDSSLWTARAFNFGAFCQYKHEKKSPSVSFPPRLMAAPSAAGANEEGGVAAVAPPPAADDSTVSTPGATVAHQTGAEEPVCFVCLDDHPPLHRPCNCNAVVHAECLVRTMQLVPTHETRCAVCKTEYKTEQVGGSRVCKFDVRFCALLTIALTPLAVVSVLYPLVPVPMQSNVPLIVCALATITMSCLGVVGLVLLYKRHTGSFAWWHTAMVPMRTLHLDSTAESPTGSLVVPSTRRMSLKFNARVCSIVLWHTTSRVGDATTSSTTQV
jgi:hypothetical protein